MVPTLEKPNIPFFVLLFTPFLKPVSFDAFPALDKLFLVWKLAVLVYLLVVLVPKCFRTVRLRLHPGIVCLFPFWLIYFIGCLRSGADVVSVGTAAIACLLLFLLILFEIRMHNGQLLMRSLSILFTGCILAHIASVFLVKAGLLYLGSTTTYLFGMDNYAAFFLYPMLAVVLFYHSLRYGQLRLQSWLLLLGVVFIFLFTRSATAAGAGMLMVVFCALQPAWKKLPKLRSVWWIIGSMTVLLVLICGFEVQNLLASLLDSMSKGVTLNSRTYIWDHALRLIVERPVFGHGSFTQEQIADYILYGTNHAHNLLIELLMRTGIVGTVCYLLFLCGISIPKHRPCAHENILLCGLVVQLVLFFMDYYATILVFYIFMAIVYYRADLCKQCKEGTTQ